jgi:hypothetical protein
VRRAAGRAHRVTTSDHQRLSTAGARLPPRSQRRAGLGGALPSSGRGVRRAFRRCASPGLRSLGTRSPASVAGAASERTAERRGYTAFE